MYKIFCLSILVLIIMSCEKDDTSIPVVSIETSEDAFLIELGEDFNVNYTLSDDIDVIKHTLTVVDGENNIIETVTESGTSGVFSKTINIAENATSPIIIKIQAVDAAGNIGSSAIELQMQGLDIKFNLLYDGQPLTYYTGYPYPSLSSTSSDSILFSKVSFFISDLSLDGNQVQEIDYLRIEKSATDTTSYEVLTYTGLNIKSGSYNNLSFDIGVPESLNSMLPSQFPSTSVLSKASEYWNNWNSYIFAKIEGNANLDSEVEGYEQGIALHLGFQDAFMEFIFDKEIVIGGLTRQVVEIDIDLIDVFRQGSDIYDIEAVPSTHSNVELPQIIELKNNFEKSLKIK